jgi:hypothetical protein
LTRSEIIRRIKNSYPNFVQDISGNTLIFKDLTRIPFDDGKSKNFSQWLENPDVKDMFRLDYFAAGPIGSEPQFDFDPGRARDEAFFNKIYGNCHDPSFIKTLAQVDWLPGKSRQKVLVSSRNGVVKKFEEVIADLEKLPDRFTKYLVPSDGTYLCRTIAGTSQRSAHSYGIAIDISVKYSHYWRWSKGGPHGPIVYRNEIPAEIVKIFEKHGFIWGGRWYHYDTMHFEYRPEFFATIK